MRAEKRTLKDVQKNGIALLGMGQSNLAVLRYLLTHHHEIGVSVPLYIRDQNPHLALPNEVYTLPMCKIVCREHWLTDINEAVIFRSPGIMPYLPPIEKAKERGACVTSEMALFDKLCPARRFAVTGSDGKTTTVSMAFHVLQASPEERGFVGGNIGISPLDKVDQMTASDKVILELSSFQLYDFCPTTERAALLNLTPNHLNWHKDMADYAKAKQNILTHTKGGVLIEDSPFSLSLLREGDSLISLSSSLSALRSRYGERPYVYLENRWVTVYYEGETHTLFPVERMALQGKHNVQNAMTVVGLLWGFVSKEVLAQGLCDFKGVPHRMTYLGECLGVKCYDSSADTTPSRTETTLASLEGKVTVICGGSSKGTSYAPLAKCLARYATHVVLYGETAADIAKEMEAFRSSQPHLSFPSAEKTTSFDEAVRLAHKITQKGDTLVLSPASASFDQFTSYVARGEAFFRVLQSIDPCMTK